MSSPSLNVHFYWLNDERLVQISKHFADNTNLGKIRENCGGRGASEISEKESTMADKEREN